MQDSDFINDDEKNTEHGGCQES
jgi:hypothetical protein